MDPSRVDSIMQYALAEARQNEDWRDRQLGPIHLIKYVYLADLEHAERTGETFTGAPWRFYHFGPYCTEVWRRTDPAMEAMGAEDCSFDSQFQSEPAKRWRSRNPDRDVERAKQSIPIMTQLAVRRAVREWGADTKSLLHFVYTTEPMRAAAPREPLEFKAREVPPEYPAEPAQTKRQEKKSKAKREEILAKLKARKSGPRKRRTSPMRQPRYDEVFFEGIEWLDSLAGGPVPEDTGTVTMDDSVWHSQTRGGGDDT